MGSCKAGGFAQLDCTNRFINKYYLNLETLIHLFYFILIYGAQLRVSEPNAWAFFFTFCHRLSNVQVFSCEPCNLHTVIQFLLKYLLIYVLLHGKEPSAWC